MDEVCRETVHRMTRRCAGWDYRQRAIYQITLVQADRRRPLLGRLVIDDPKAPPEAVTARLEPSALGAAILVHWKRLGDFTPEIKPLFCQLMPDHLHAILDVTRPMAKPLGNAIGGFKTGCEKIYRGLAPSERDKAATARAPRRLASRRARRRRLAAASVAVAGPVLCQGRKPLGYPASGRRGFKTRFSFAPGSSTRCSTTCATTRVGSWSSGSTPTFFAPWASCDGLCRGWGRGRIRGSRQSLFARPLARSGSGVAARLRLSPRTEAWRRAEDRARYGGRSRRRERKRGVHGEGRSVARAGTAGRGVAFALRE